MGSRSEAAKKAWETMRKRGTVPHGKKGKAKAKAKGKRARKGEAPSAMILAALKSPKTPQRLKEALAKKYPSLAKEAGL